MCCIFTALVFVGPRFGLLLWWLFDPVRFDATFGDRWLLALLAFIFLPWTELMYMVVAPFGAVTAGPDIQGFDWVWLGLSVVIDVLSYGGGLYGNRQQVYAYVPAAAMGSDYPYTPPPVAPPPPPASDTTTT